MAVDVGDAVLKFIGDTQDLDQKFASVGPKAEAAFGDASKAAEGFGEAANEAGDEAEDAGKRTRVSMGEARGEVALLGEEFGIRLPRHVRSFVAELPGVGEALSAAFSATAVLFLIQALSEATEKASNFIAGWLVYTQSMKDTLTTIAAENVELVKQGKLFDDAKNKLEALNQTPMEKLQSQLKEANIELKKLSTEDIDESLYDAKVKAQKEIIALIQAQIDKQAEADKKTDNSKALNNLKAEIELRKQLANVQVSAAEAINAMDKENADEVRYQISIKALRALADAEKQYGTDNKNTIAKINADIEQLTVEHTLKLQDELNKQKEALEKTLDEMQKDVKASDGVEIITPANVQRIYQGIEAVKSLGITLRSELLQRYNEAKAAEDAFAASGINDTFALKAIQAAVKKADDDLKHYGDTMDHTKAKSELTWKSIIQDWHNGANAQHAAGELAAQTFNQVSAAMTNAFEAAILGQGKWGKALEEATRSAIASLAAQALVKALFYTAEGFAALAMSLLGNPSAGAAATQYFTAAGEMAALGGVAGGVARAMPGGGGGTSSSTIQQNNGVSNTSGSGGASGVTIKGVQRFAEGGLVSAPTLALIGEGGGREAVLPLDDEDAMERIGARVAKHVAAASGAQGGGLNVHVGGLVSDDKLIKGPDVKAGESRQGHTSRKQLTSRHETERINHAERGTANLPLATIREGRFDASHAYSEAAGVDGGPQQGHANHQHANGPH